MSLFVKLCGMKSERDVEAAVAAGADAVGFVLTESRRRLSVEEAARLRSRLPADILAVAVFNEPTPELLARALDEMAPDLLQADPESLEPVPPQLRLPVVVGGDRLEAALTTTPRRVALVDSALWGGTGRAFDWEPLARSPFHDRVLVAGGLAPGNVASAVEMVRPFGVDVSSGIEGADGDKDPALMRAFVAAARSVAPSDPQESGVENKEQAGDDDR